MRLCGVLTDAPDPSSTQVEGFLGSTRIAVGRHKPIEVGTVVRYYYCVECEKERSFSSAESRHLSCLRTGERTVSIDVVLTCTVCSSAVEAWFVVSAEDDLFAASPTVRVEKFTDHRRGVALSSGAQRGGVDDWFTRAQSAYESGLGAGAMIYLRKIFESTTTEAAEAMGISTKRKNGWRRTFRDLLEEVDKRSHIVPAEFSDDGYRLFSELSEVIHGDTGEQEALAKYEPCHALVFGIVQNVRNNARMAQAAASLWSDGDRLAEVRQIGRAK